MTLGESGNFCNNHHVDHAWFNWKNSSCASIGGSFFGALYSPITSIYQTLWGWNCQVVCFVTFLPKLLRCRTFEWNLAQRRKSLALFTHRIITKCLFGYDNMIQVFPHKQHYSLIWNTSCNPPGFWIPQMFFRLVGENFLWNEGCGEYSDRCFGERILLIGAEKNHPAPLVFKVTKWV